MSGQYCENYDVKRETVEADMMSLESHQVFKKIAFVFNIYQNGRFNPFVLPYSKSLNGFVLQDQRILFPSNL